MAALEAAEAALAELALGIQKMESRERGKAAATSAIKVVIDLRKNTKVKEKPKKQKKRRKLQKAQRSSSTRMLRTLSSVVGTSSFDYLTLL